MLTWLGRWIVAVVAEDIGATGEISEPFVFRAPGDLRRDCGSFRSGPE